MHTNKWSVLFSVMFSVLLLSCFSTKETKEEMDFAIFWVNSMKVPCDAGVAKMQCLSIHKGDDAIYDSDWELFYAEIEGFTFEFGTFQKIKVQEEKLDPKDVPADGSLIKYKLIEIVEKKVDPRVRLYDIWAVTHLNAKQIDKKGPRPNMEINISTMEIIGNDGCNQYFGKIEKLSGDQIQLGRLGATKKLCQDMTVPDQFTKVLGATSTYKLSGLMLTFLDESGNELVRFQKID